MVSVVVLVDGSGEVVVMVEWSGVTVLVEKVVR